MRREWIESVLPKMALTLILPLAGSLSPGDFSYYSVLLRIGENQGIFPVNLNPHPLYFALFYFLMTIPALLFHYAQFHRPSTQTVTKLFLPVFFFGQPLVQVLVLTPFMLMASSTPDYSVVTSAGMLVVMLAPWSLILLVILPFFLREVRTRRDTNMEIRFLGEISRYTLGVFVLILVITVIPTIFVATQTWFLAEYYFLSSVGASQFIGGGYHFSVFHMIYFASIAGVVLLHLVFAKEIIKYLHSKASRYRTIVIGIATTILSSFVPSWFQFMGPRVDLAAPIPSVLLVGIVIVYGLKPFQIDDDLWDDAPHKMWFEKDLSSSGENPEIKVPLTHMIRSKLSRTKKAEQAYDWDKKDDEVFSRAEREEI